VNGKNAIPGCRKTSHQGCSTCCIGCGLLLPDNSSHIIKPDAFTEFDYLSSDGNNFIASIIYSPRKLITYVDTQPATVVKYPVTLFPNQIKIIYIGFIIFVITYLILCPIVL